MGCRPKFELGVVPPTKKGKRKSTVLTFTSAKRRHSICKNLIVFKHMGSDNLSEFSRLDKYILLNGMVQFDLNSTETEILDNICNVITSSSTSPEVDLSHCSPQDIEFIKCVGRICRVSQMAPDFTWSGTAVKHLCGQGDLYVRLKRDAVVNDDNDDRPDESDKENDDDDELLETPGPMSTRKPVSTPPISIVQRPRSVSTPVQGPRSMSTQSVHRPESVSTQRPGSMSTPQLVQRSGLMPTTRPLLIPLSNSLESFPGPSIARASPTPVLDSVSTYENGFDLSAIYEMFPAFSKHAIDVIQRLSSMNNEKTINILLDIDSQKILSLLQQQKMNGPPMKVRVDEDDLLNDALLFYKAVTFDPS